MIHTITTFRKLTTTDTANDFQFKDNCGKELNFVWTLLTTSSDFMQHDQDGTFNL